MELSLFSGMPSPALVAHLSCGLECLARLIDAEAWAMAPIAPHWSPGFCLICRLGKLSELLTQICLTAVIPVSSVAGTFPHCRAQLVKH